MTGNAVLDTLASRGFPVYLRSFSAVDSYLERDAGSAVLVLSGAEITDLARLFENLRYPGIDLADAALDHGGQTCYFRCAGFEEISGQAAFAPLEFYQDWKTRSFYDPRGVYPLLRTIKQKPRKPAGAGPDVRGFSFEMLRETFNPGADRLRALMDGALILAKYFPGLENTGYIKKIAELFPGQPETAPGTEEQRLLLTGLLSAPGPGPGLELLKRCGFIGRFWPELALLDNVEQSKEFHPEGNAWKHTLETFRYRKPGIRGVYDLRLSLGLLLHDTGKPIAESSGSRRFHGHAELGERQARRLLERLDFDTALISDVCYLVKNHMLPAALPRLPLVRTGGIMASPLFPVLLELYRCDESSSFKGLDGYYESSAIYRSYLRNQRNPYRSADGKKLNPKQVFGTAADR